METEFKPNPANIKAFYEKLLAFGMTGSHKAAPQNTK